MHGLFVPKALFAGGLLVLAMIVTAVTVSMINGRSDCRADVRSRDGQRTMWLYVIDTFPANEFVIALHAELDRRIPALECKGFISVNAVPVEGP